MADVIDIGSRKKLRENSCNECSRLSRESYSREGEYLAVLDRLTARVLAAREAEYIQLRTTLNKAEVAMLTAREAFQKHKQSHSTTAAIQ